jgi:hypothetical protein
VEDEPTNFVAKVGKILEGNKTKVIHTTFSLWEKWGDQLMQISEN